MINYILASLFIFSTYNFYKIFRVIIKEIEQEMLFLSSNSISRVSIGFNYFKKDMIFVGIIIVIYLLITFLITNDVFCLLNIGLYSYFLFIKVYH